MSPKCPFWVFMCLSDPLYGFIVGSDGIVAIYGVESRRSPQAEGVQYLIAGAEGGDGDNMTPGRTQPLERDTLDLKKGGHSCKIGNAPILEANIPFFMFLVFL